MRRLGFSRPVGVLLLVGGLLMAVAACALATRLLGALPLFGRSPAAAVPVRITTLPTPVVTRPQWTSYTYTGPINDLALNGGLIWAATDGGLVVWDGTGAAVRFVTEHGLAANRVNSIAIGRDGTVWAGTVGGVSRYDGRAWQTFTTANGLPHDFVHDVAVDRDGLVWAATTAGLARYDGQSWRIYSSSGLFAQLPDDLVYALAIDSANRLWVATSGGLSRLADGRWTTLTVADGLPDSAIYRLAIGPGDVVWGATDIGLARVDSTTVDAFAPGVALAEQQNLGKIKGLAVAADGAVYQAYAFDGTLERFDPSSGDSEIISAGPRPGGWTWPGALLFDESGVLWAGMGDTVRRLAGGQWSMLPGVSDVPSNIVTDLAHDGRALWLSSVMGVARFDGRWQSFGLADGLPTTDTRALAVAPDGALWAAFDNPLRGVAKYGSDGWQTVTCPTAAPTSAQVNGAAQTPGALWFATATGVSRYDGVAWQTFDRRDGLPDDAVNDVAAHGDTLWAATATGIARYDGRWRVVSDETATALAVAPDGALWAYNGRAVFRVGEEASRAALPLPTAVRGLAATDDAVWLATPDGVLRYHGAWAVFTPDDGLPTLDVTAIGAGADGRVWAATSGDAGQIEIVVFDGARWVAHPNRDVAAEQLAGNSLTRSLAAPDGDVWLATSAGVERFHDGRWSVYTMDQGLPDGSITALAWADDTVWAGTQAGLARFDGQSWQPFGGATPEQVGPAVSALAVAPSGELWVATSEASNRLRTYDGRAWTTVPLPTPTMFVAQMAVTAAGQLVVVAYDDGAVLLGIYDGRAWVWHASEALQLEPRWLDVTPDGRLWLTGLARDAATLPEVVDSPRPGAPEPTSDNRNVVAVFELGSQGLGREVGRFQASDIVTNSWYWLGSIDPIVVGPDGRVYVAGHEKVYVFNGTDDIVPAETLDLTLPFSLYTTSAAMAADGRLWLTTDTAAAVWDGRTWDSYYAPPRAPAWWGSVTALLPRADDGIVLGTSGGGLGLYTGRAFTGLTNQQEWPAWDGRYLPITDLLYREAGELWAASADGGVGRLTETEWQVFAPDVTLAQGVTTLAATNDRLWLGTAAGWAAVELVGDSCRYAAVEAGSWVSEVLLDGQRDVWVAMDQGGVMRLSDELGQTRELAGNVRQIALSPNGELWFADDRQPWLLRYRPGGGEDAWSRLPFDLDVITPESLAALAVGPNLDLWLGGSISGKDGLVRFSSGRWSRLTTADGLADNWVLDVVVAPDGAVWAATYGGLSRFRP